MITIGEKRRKHVLDRCEETKQEITTEDFLNGDEKSQEIMKGIDRIRETKEERKEDRKENTGMLKRRSEI